MDFWCRNRRRWGAISELPSDACYILWGFGGFKISWKMDVKMTSKIKENESFWRSGVGFLRFLEVWGGSDFRWILMSFSIGKKLSKNQKKCNFGCQKQSSGRGRRQRVGPVRLWSLKISEICEDLRRGSSTPFQPCPEAGGGGSECAMRREHRRPLTL